ncbi:MAG: N-acetylmuramoyl-L-alanine amidase [Rubrobacter sp.]|nr:N-acetylmuramoyl-L-alanine amidase [Rubrobacter sp.]
MTLRSASNGTALQATSDGGVFTSRVLQSSASFTHVGLHWSAAVPSDAGLNFELRTSADGATWSSWSSAQLRRLPEETPAGDYFASLVYADGARFVQYRASFETAGGSSPSLKRVTATVIDSPPTTASATAGDQLPTTPVQDADSGRTLTVTSREQWEANEKYRFDRRGRELWPEMFVPAKKLVVHHTATRNDYATAAEAAAEVRAVYYYHAVTQRYGDVGYTALIDKFGNVYEGRHGRVEGTGREILSAGVVAGHDYAHNYGSAGVALLGDAEQAGWTMTSDTGPMWDALVRFGVFEAGRHYMRPLSADGSTAVASDFLRSDNVWTNGMHNVSGHRETNNTACPGEKVMSLLDELRSAIHSGLADTSRAGLTLSNPPPSTRETRVGTTVTFTWQDYTPEAPWTLTGYEYCLEGWYKPSNSINITYLKGYTAETQPRLVWNWTPVDSGTTSISLPLTKAGQYTFHVRAVLTNGTDERRSAYEGRHTYLVK